MPRGEGKVFGTKARGVLKELRDSLCMQACEAVQLPFSEKTPVHMQACKHTHR